MRVFPTPREVRRARTRTVLFFFKAIAFVMFAVAAAIAIHYLLGWW